MQRVKVPLVTYVGLLALLGAAVPAVGQAYRPVKFQQDLRRAQIHLAAMQRLLNRVATRHAHTTVTQRRVQRNRANPRTNHAIRRNHRRTRLSR